jgi:glycosyltransferase involved in cell wall biosynthesis
MNVAVMMRAMDHPGGLGLFTESLVRNLLQLDNNHSYLLLYKEPKHFGRFAGFKNARELLVRCGNKLIWDQLLVPLAAWRTNCDIILNPKFSVPLVTHCPVAMGIQEPAWWAIPDYHTKLDVFYMRLMLPLYCRKAAHLFPWSNFVLDENRKYLHLPLENATLTPFAPETEFGQLHDAATLSEFRRHNGLPEKFVLTVTRVLNMGNKSGAFTGTKNLETTVRAFCQIRKRVPHKLVVVGRRAKEYLEHVGWTDFENIQFAVFPHQDMPKVYQASELCVLPAFYEGCPTTLIESMASGCVTVASNIKAFAEVSAGAALLADPHDPSDFARKMLQGITDKTLRHNLREKSLRRAQLFNWDRTARLTLKALENVVEGRAKKKSRRYRRLTKQSPAWETLRRSWQWASSAMAAFVGRIADWL